MSDLHYLPVSLGEAIDKLAILDIKLNKITDERKNNVKVEYDILFKILEQDIEKYTFYYNIMKIVNLEIWDMMNDLRDAKAFDENYMFLSKECMISNDIRFRIKNKINYISKCSLKEQKGYKVMRILLDIRNSSINLDNLINPIRYYTFLYDEIYILINTNDVTVFENIFSYDPTIFVTNKDEILNLNFKKIFDLRYINVFTKEKLYASLEITDEIENKYFLNF